MFKFLKEYLPYYKNYKIQFLFAFIGMILVSAASAATAYLVKPVLDKIFIEKNEQMLYILPVLIILAYFLKGVGNIIQKYYISFIGEDIIRQIRDKFLSHILTLDLEFFKTTHSGELLSRIINDINRIQRAVSSDFANFIQNILMALFLIGVVIYQNPKLAFFSLVILPLMVYPVSIISKKLKKISKISQEKTANLNSQLSEIFRNIETIKSFNAKEIELKKFAQLNQEYLNINLKAVKTSALLIPILETLSATIAAVVIIVGGKEVIDGEMSVGAFFSFMTALFMMTDPIRRAANIYANFQNAIAANERLKDIFKLKPTINSGDKEIKNIQKIEFKGVSLKYQDKTALNKINYQTTKPKIVGLVGDSGSGKSSFIYLIMRFYNPSSGEILINGEKIDSFDIEQLRDKIGYISQNIHIFNDTIAANIAYGKEINREKIIDVLKKANLLDFVNSLEKGIDTVLNENGSNLSGGQKQRISIARALYKDPEILILDEATSALDNKSEAIIIQTIQQFKDKLIFIVAHRLSTIENSDEILVFKDGKIVCQGDKESLLNECEEFKKLYKGIK